MGVKSFFKKNCLSAQAPISHGPRFRVFRPFLTSPQNSEYFEHRNIGLKKSFPPREAKKFSSAFGANSCPRNLKLQKTGSEAFGGGSGFEQAAPVGQVYVAEHVCLAPHPTTPSDPSDAALPVAGPRGSTRTHLTWGSGDPAVPPTAPAYSLPPNGTFHSDTTVHRMAWT